MNYAGCGVADGRALRAFLIALRSPKNGIRYTTKYFPAIYVVHQEVPPAKQVNGRTDRKNRSDSRCNASNTWFRAAIRGVSRFTFGWG